MRLFGVKNKVGPEKSLDSTATGPLDHIKKKKADVPQDDRRPNILVNVANVLMGRNKSRQKKKRTAAKKLQSKVKNDRRLKPVRQRQQSRLRETNPRILAPPFICTARPRDSAGAAWK